MQLLEGAVLSTMGTVYWAMFNIGASTLKDNEIDFFLK
jgi:hypothetical protein